MSYLEYIHILTDNFIKQFAQAVNIEFCGVKKMRKPDSNNRRTYSVHLKCDIYDNFKAYCEVHGYSISRRLEIIMLKEIDKETKT